MDPQPQDPALAHAQRGVAHFNQGRYAEAVAELEAVVRLQPDSAGALSNLATALGQAGRTDECLATFRRVLDLEPAVPTAWLNVVGILDRIGRPLDAVAGAREAQRRFAGDAGVHVSAGLLYYAQGLREEAQAAFARALAIDSRLARARWMQAIVALPQAYGPDEDPAAFRRIFEDELRALGAWFDESRAPLAEDSVAERQPFYLAFMEESNKALLCQYGDLCARLMQQHVAVLPAGPAAAEGPVRVAIVSAHLFDQSVWTALVRGWCAHLDRSKVELHLFYTGTLRDAQTEIARSHAASFAMGLGPLGNWIREIGALAPDVILYPEIGMDATTARLAALRLAPVQVVAWGHPETSGYPTVDYYLSAAAFEPADAQAHYRETLVPLPGMGCYYDDLVPDYMGTDWAALGVDALAPRLLCAGTPYKYMPRDDHLLVEIARRVPDVQLLFFRHKAPLLSERVERRLALAFANAGLDAARNVRFLPRQSRPAFFGMLRDCDAMLDTVGFSGFNTAMQAIECDLPIVAWEGRFMRGRLASGTLRAIGMDDLVATTPAQYVDLAARLARDGTWRLQAAARIGQRKSALFRQQAPVQALERFLLEVAGRHGRIAAMKSRDRDSPV